MIYATNASMGRDSLWSGCASIPTNNNQFQPNAFRSNGQPTVQQRFTNLLQSQQPPPPPQQPQPQHFQKSHASEAKVGGATAVSRRFSSSGTPNALNFQNTVSNGGGGQPPAPLNRRASNNRSAYRSATFHNNNSTNSNANPTVYSTAHRQPMAPRSAGALRTSSSFHGSIQSSNPSSSYSGRNSYGSVAQSPLQAGPQPPKSTIYAVSGNFQPGMKDVPIWLKSLRLHKYTRMFQEMSYEQMMSLNEQKLEQRQVTKGARKKILQSLDKLRDRSQLIRQLEKCIDDRGDVRCLIVELRTMMNTPIAAYNPNEDPKPSNYMIDAIGIPAVEISDENLPGHIARLCIRLHEYLFRNGLPQIQALGIEDEYVQRLLQIYDKIVANEAFTIRQKYCINECKRVLSRYIQEQPMVAATNSNSNNNNNTNVFASSQNLISSPGSSGYNAMSPPSSSTRRNSDTKESVAAVVDDLTGTTGYFYSDDDFIGRSSDSNSPPAGIQRQSPPWTLTSQPAQQQKSMAPPGFEWTSTGTGAPTAQQTTNNRYMASADLGSAPTLSSQQLYNLAATIMNSNNNSGATMGQPLASYVQPTATTTTADNWYETANACGGSISSLSSSNRSLIGSPVAQQQHQRSFAGQWDARPAEADKNTLTALLDSNPSLYSYFVQQFQQQQQQLPTASNFSNKPPPKTPSPIGTRPSATCTNPPQNGSEKQFSTEPLMLPLTIAEKLRFIAENTDEPEILDVALHLAMNRLRLQKQREAQPNNSPMLWQNVKEPVKQRQAPPPAQNNNWLWGNVVRQQQQQQEFRSPQDQQQQQSRCQNNGQCPSSADSLPRILPKTTHSESYDPWAKYREDIATPPMTGEQLFNGAAANHTLGSNRSTAAAQSNTTPTSGGGGTETTNLLGRMLNDSFGGCQAGQKQQWILQQYAGDDQIPSLNVERLFASTTPNASSYFNDTNQQRHHHQDQQQQQLFAAFRPLACTASGATVH